MRIVTSARRGAALILCFLGVSVSLSASAAPRDPRGRPAEALGPCCALSEEAWSAVRGVVPEHLVNPEGAWCGTGSYTPLHILWAKQGRGAPMPSRYLPARALHG